MAQPNQKKVMPLFRWFMRESKEGAAVRVLLPLLTPEERADVLKVLGELVADDEAHGARRDARVRAAVAELEAFRARDGLLQ